MDEGQWHLVLSVNSESWICWYCCLNGLDSRKKGSVEDRARGQDALVPAIGVDCFYH